MTVMQYKNNQNLLLFSLETSKDLVTIKMTVIVVGNGIGRGDQSSNPGRSYLLMLLPNALIHVFSSLL